MSFLNQGEFSLPQKINNLNWLLIYLILSLIAIGCLMLYSAGGGSFQPWLIRQLVFVLIFFPIMIVIAIIDIRFWFKIAYLAYGVALLMVIFVDIAGHNALGATRWFRIGPLTIQPSEIMKVCLIFALARYYSDIEVEEVGKLKYTIIPLLLIAVPVFFVFDQPDLGTASILLLSGVAVLFAAGIKLWKFIAVGIAGLISIPFLWTFVLYDYQKQRVLTFLNPNNDPLGSGYNIIQSKIAIGSGGFIGSDCRC